MSDTDIIRHQLIAMNTKPHEPVPALNHLDRPPFPLTTEQKKFILTFGSFAKQAKREGRYNELFYHTVTRWWQKWPLDRGPTATSITNSKLVRVPVRK